MFGLMKATDQVLWGLYGVVVLKAPNLHMKGTNNVLQQLVINSCYVCALPMLVLLLV